MIALFTRMHTLVNVREDIHLLRGKDLQDLPFLHNVHLLVKDKVIAAYGTMDTISSIACLPYAFGHNHIDKVILKGAKV